jgi:hypothetical protein
MKYGRFIMIAAAVLALLPGCAKTESAPGNKISFRVARFRSMVKAEPYKERYSDVPFGAYAWYKDPNPAKDTVFMSNQKVTYNAETDRWMPSGVNYYWPRTGSLDFICYSPYLAQGGPVVQENSIRYSSYDVYANPDVDLLYADKVTGLSDSFSAPSNGVPIIFRHALAQVNFVLRLAYVEKTGGTSDKTRWEVRLDSFELKGLHGKGDLQLSLSDGVWQKPSANVWTTDGSTGDLAFDCSSLGVFSDFTPQVIGSALVLPQMIGGVRAVLKFTISTYRDTGHGYGSEPFIVERGVELEADLASPSLNRWGINHNVVYNIVLSPSRSGGEGGASTGPDPVVITFDPAVDDWQNINIETSIGL